MPVPSQEEIDEIDRFLASPKTLDGGFPVWKGGRFHRKNQEHAATWPIADDLGIVGRGQRFAYRSWMRLPPSISLVHGQRPVARIDFDDAQRCKYNPYWAATSDPRVCGTHIHRWETNRDYIASQDIWSHPCREALPAQLRKLDQALCWLAEYANIRLVPNQRGFEEPQGFL
jgi:hypothetical protein